MNNKLIKNLIGSLNTAPKTINSNNIPEKTFGKVYWISCKLTDDITKEGYVGVSNNIERRFSEHKTRETKSYFKNIINSKGWKTLKKSIIFEGNMEDCLKLEFLLRPKNNLGWNLVKGGGFPPICTTETALKIHQSKLDSGYYKSKDFRDQCKLGADTKRDRGFYDFDKSQERNIKACRTRRKNGYYDSEDFKKSRLKSEKTKKDKGYYNSDLFKLNHNKTMESRKLNNKVFQQSVVKLDKKSNKEISSYPNFYEAAKSINVPAYVINEVIRGKRKTSKGFIFKIKQ